MTAKKPPPRRSSATTKAQARAARLETKIGRLSKEIEDIDQAIYSGVSDPDGRYFMLERKRDDIVRATVLQLHTSIEDLLDIWLHSHLMGESARNRPRRGARSKAVFELLKGGRAIGFDAKIRLLRALGLLRQPTIARLVELNKLRNRCSHNWLLKAHVRRGVKRRAPKRPLLQYGKGNLYHSGPLMDFHREFTRLYVRLFLKVYE